MPPHASTNPAVESILVFWLGHLDGPADVDTAKSKIWWGGDDALDTDVTERFAELVEAARAGELDAWCETPHGTLALVILLDVSSSMEQRDIQPSRLQRAKQKIADLLAMRTDKQTALIVYAGTAHTVLTLTDDQDILKQYLAAITPKIMPRAGKFPEYSLPLVDQVLRESNAPAT